jgi:MYXO-CTERM domain-containing protein
MRATNWLVNAFALAAPLAVAATAYAAPVPECGNIDFSAGVQCSVEVSGGCTTKCTPVNFELQCSADLTVQCNGGCNVMAEASCTGSCNTNCQAECTANAQFDCQASCTGSCNADCSGQCTTAENKGQCEASCKANCSGSCDSSCQASGSADCNAKCTGSCQGQCKAEANADCQINCQSMGYAKCESDLTGGCQTQCSQPEGALFCNGQYIDLSNSSLDDCLGALLATYEIKANGYSYGSCDENGCSGKAGGSVNCSTANVGAGDYALGSFGALGAIGVALSLTRRRRRPAA